MSCPPVDRRLSVAPMMDWTDRFDRAFLRCMTRQTLLYSEMVVTGAILFGQRDRFLGFDHQIEGPVALQLGGSNPQELAECARLAEGYGYCEINLNVGCPSDRVSAGRFGACLMAEPALVAECLQAMQQATSLPVTVKHRIGIDDLDSYDHLRRFIETVVQGSECRVFVIHARKAWLSGLSPRENREIPPLRHDVVHQVKADYPELSIVLNGGLSGPAECLPHLRDLQGCMIGRAAYETPYVMASADQVVYGSSDPVPSRMEVMSRYRPYIAEQLHQGVPLGRMARHILPLFHGQPGGKLWRRHLSENAFADGAGLEVIDGGLEIVSRALAARELAARESPGQQ